MDEETKREFKKPNEVKIYLEWGEVVKFWSVGILALLLVRIIMWVLGYLH